MIYYGEKEWDRKRAYWRERDAKILLRSLPNGLKMMPRTDRILENPGFSLMISDINKSLELLKRDHYRGYYFDVTKKLLRRAHWGYKVELP